jgi:peptide/nickel transport system permease protein
VTMPASIPPVAVRRRQWASRLGRGAGSQRGTLVAAGVIGLVVVCCALAPWLAPHDPNAVDLGSVDAGTSTAHLLGTDGVGRDLLSRLLFGGRTTLLVPLLVTIGAGLAGTTLAMLSAWVGRWLDYLIARAFDIMFSFPGILLAILATAVLGAGLWTMTLALVIAYTPYVGRIIRSETIRQRNLPYISAASLQGSSTVGIWVRHLLPNVAPLLYAQLTLAYAYSLLDAASLSFLGLGIQPPTPDWGVMVSEGEPGLTGGHPQESLYAGICIVVFVVAVSVIGNRLADRAEARA